MPTRDYKESLFEELKDPEFVVAYLNAALEEETQDIFLLHLRDVADAWGGLGKLATETSMAREALYRMLSEHGNPQLSSLEKILQVLGLRLAVTRASEKAGDALTLAISLRERGQRRERGSAQP